jgi:hypothetical protein
MRLSFEVRGELEKRVDPPGRRHQSAQGGNAIVCLPNILDIRWSTFARHPPGVAQFGELLSGVERKHGCTKKSQCRADN